MYKFMMYKLIIIGILFLLGFYFIYKSNDIETFSTNDDTDQGTLPGKNYKIAEKCPDVLIQKGAAFFLYNSKRANVPGINPIRFESLEEYTEFTEWQRSQGILCPVLFLQHAYDAQGEPVYKARPSPTNLQGGQPDYIVTSESLPSDQVKYPTIPPAIMPPPAKFPVQGLYAQNGLVAMPGAAMPGAAMPGAAMPGALPQNSMRMDYTNANMVLNMGSDTGGINPYAGANNNYPGFDAQNQLIGCNSPLDKMFNQTNGVSPNPMDDNWGGVEYTESLVKAGYYKGDEVSIAGA
jgi:hypothetical protein